MLLRLLKTAIGAALLNRVVRSALLAALVKSVDWILRPSNISRIVSFFKGAAELLLLRFEKRSGFFGPAAISALVSLLLAMMRWREENPGTSSKMQKDQIIDIDEYTIIEDKY
jgi:hypothetical protein